MSKDVASDERPASEGAGARTVEWERMPSLPEGAGGFVCGADGNDLVLLGGVSWRNDVKIYRDSILRFDSQAGKWTAIATLPEPVGYAAFGQAPEGIYFAGGSDGRTTQDTLRLLGRNFDVRTIARIPRPLCYSGNAIGAGKLFVISGATDANDLKTLTNLSDALDLKTGAAVAMPPYPGGSLLLPAAAMAGQQIYVFTGAAWDAGGHRAVNTDAAFTYSISTGEWQPLKPYPFPVRGLAACALDEHYILLGGGYGETFTNFAAIYDTKRDVYVPTIPLPTSAMANLIKAGDFIYWVGGEHAMRQRSDVVFRIRWKTLLDKAP